jgi:hypothetical protein
VVGIYKSSTIPNVSRSADFTYGTAIVLIWLVAEVSATIIAASIPFYRPLVRRFSSKKGTQESYGMSNRSRTRAGHSKLRSQDDAKSAHVIVDDCSDKGILDGNTQIVRKTNITVEYDNYSGDEESAGPKRAHRDNF